MASLNNDVTRINLSLNEQTNNLEQTHQLIVRRKIEDDLENKFPNMII